MTENSSSDDAVRAATEVMSSMDIAMLTTVDAGSSTGRLTSRPLSTHVHEDDGDVLFLVRRDSGVVTDIRANLQVNVAYSSMKAWVSLAGTAEVIDDRDTVARLWSSGADRFMEGGPEDPDNVVLKVHGDSVTYWGGDSLVGTAVETAKMVAGKDEDGDRGPTQVDLP